MTIDDIELMTVKDRARRLVGDMPWVTEHLTSKQLADLPKQIEASMMAAVLQEREACAKSSEACAEAWSKNRTGTEAICDVTLAIRTRK